MTADGKRVVSGSVDNTIKVWNLETGKEERTLSGHSGGVYAVSVTADGKRVVSGSWDTTIKVWNLETGKEESLASGEMNPGCARAEGSPEVCQHSAVLVLQSLSDGV